MRKIRANEIYPDKYVVATHWIINYLLQRRERVLAFAANITRPCKCKLLLTHVLIQFECNSR